MKKLSMTLGRVVLVGAVALFALAPGAAVAQDIEIDGSTTVGPIAKAFAEYYMRNTPGVNINVSESGSGNGAKSLINSTCHIGAMSRFMKDTEFKAAVDAGVTPVAHVVALDGIAVVVHPSNPVQNLTMSQIKDIYLGKTKSWSELGGPDVPMVVISRDTNSGTYETFDGLVMQKEKMASEVQYVNSNGNARDRVRSTPAAVAYVGIGFLDDSMKALEVDGVYPSLETVKSGVYPIARPLYMFTNGYPKLGSHLFRFMTLHLTPRGQDMVEEIGFVPVTSY